MSALSQIQLCVSSFTRCSFLIQHLLYNVHTYIYIWIPCLCYVFMSYVLLRIVFHSWQPMHKFRDTEYPFVDTAYFLLDTECFSSGTGTLLRIQDALSGCRCISSNAIALLRKYCSMIFFGYRMVYSVLCRLHRNRRYEDWGRASSLGRASS